MKASDLFVKCLENEGVQYIFGIPGEENLDLLESLRTSKIQLIVTRHEQAAAFMAATYGRLTGRVGVALSTLGPGATNLVTGVAYAQLGAMPLLVITGQKPIKKSKQGRFQIIDVVEMMKPITKFTKQITHGNTIPALLRESVKRAEEERPGAVHLELPEDIAAEETDAEVFARTKVRRPAPDPRAIEWAVDAIESAKKPLVVVGAGANRKRNANALENFLQKTGIPFCNTQMGKGMVGSLHDQYIGTAALSDGDFVHRAIECADLVINVGHDVIEKPPFFMHHDDTRKVLHINFCSAEVDEIYFPDIEVVGDISRTLTYLSEQITMQTHWDFARFQEVQGVLRMHISEKETAKKFPLLPQRIVHDVREAVPRDGIICLDNGMYKLWFARQYVAHEYNTLLVDNALATMGAGLPSAMAAKMVHPERKVMAICGDGGFLMNSQEVETAVRLELDLVILVLRDDAYGMIKWKQEGMKFADFGLDYGNPDFVAYAQSYGAKGHRIKKTEDFVPILKKCLKSKGVHLVEIPIDYSENHRVFHEELPRITKNL